MKRITLTIVTLTAAASAVMAQDPTPPAARPAPTPRPDEVRPVVPPAAATPAPRARKLDRNGDEFYIDRAEIEAARDRAMMQREEWRIDAERVREIASEARAYATTIEPTTIAAMKAFGPMATVKPMTPMAPKAFGYVGEGFARTLPPAPWAQGDPADSVYRSARELLDRGEYGRSAKLFSDIQKNYPTSAYKTAAQYWEAFARYRIGTTDELRQAAKILEPVAARVTPGTSSNYTVDRRTPDSDITSLYARINGVLAMRGDADAAARVSKAASAQGTSCDDEDQRLRGEALSALSQMDPATALPLLRKVVDRKDECSASLRRNAVFILSRRADTESGALLLSVAKSDPNMSVRVEAVNGLARIPGDVGLNALEDILRNEQEERLQRAAVGALMRSDNQKARAGMRALIDRKDAPMNLRIEAINSFSAERATTDDAAYLRGLYAKADNDQLKIAVVNAVGRIGGAENDAWVMNIARNQNEPSSVRATAINRFMRSNTVAVADLVKLYDASAESREIRSRVISMLGQRKEPEAADKLYDIARSSTDVPIRMQALNALSNKKDPRATKLLEDILDGKKP